MLLDLILLALKRVKNRMVESVVVIISLAFGLAIVSTIISIMISFNQEMSEVSDHPWKRRIWIGPAEWGGSEFETSLRKVGQADQLERYLFNQEELNLIKESCPSIDYSMIQNWVGENDEEAVNWWENDFSQNGVNQDWFDFNRLGIASGSFFSEEDYEMGNSVVILGGNLKTLKYGEEDPVGQIITIEDQDYTIIGVLEEHYNDDRKSEIEQYRLQRWNENNRIYLPYTTKTWWEDKKRFQHFTLGIDDVTLLESAVEEVTLYMAEFMPQANVNISSSLDHNTEENHNTAKNILLVLGFISGIALLIASLTNLNLMLARVSKDKKGVGIAQALGATKRLIFINTLLEATLIGIIGTILGLILLILFTMGVGALLNESVSIVQATFNGTTIIVNIILATLVTTIFSIFPAIEATKFTPTQVLRED